MVEIHELFDRTTSTLTYVVSDPHSKVGLIIDPVWDYDPAASKVSRESADNLLNYIRLKNLQIEAILETHAHADHLSSSQILKSHLPHARVGIGKQITQVQKTFKRIFNFDDWFKTDGSQFDFLLQDNQEFSVGPIQIKVLFTPGHTPACVSYLIDDAVFTGDALFMPDSGTGRCDFPEGNAGVLYDSISKRLYTLPETTRVFTGHDYQPNGRPLNFMSSIGEQKASNIHLNQKTSKEDYIQFREARDKTLSAPRLLLPSLQVNLCAGRLPPAESNGISYLKYPVQGL